MPSCGRPWVRSLVVSLLALIMAAASSRAEEPRSPRPPRLALVIGVSRYAVPLPTAGNDAGLVTRALSQAGFAVTAAADVDRSHFDAVVQDFLATLKASPGATILVYIAGYGLQYAGDVYLAPLGATIARGDDVPTEAASLSAVAHAIEALPAASRLFVYDIARAHPFAKKGSQLASGLPWITPGPGTIVATNAAPGTVATPDAMPYGFYARALAEAIDTPGLPLALLMERVRLRVAMLTNGATIPWNAGSVPTLMQSASEASRPLAVQAPIDPGTGSAVDAAYIADIAQDTLDGYLAFLSAYPSEPLAARIRTIVAVRREVLIWNESRRVDSDRAYWTYLRRYPRGPHIADARRRLMLLQAALEPPMRFDILPALDAPPPLPSELALIDRAFVTLDDMAWPAVPPLEGTLPPPQPAFYDGLPPPPLVTAGRLPIAAPIPGVLRETATIGQPVVPGGPALASETRFTADGSIVVTSVAGGAPIEKITTTILPNGNRTIVQSEPDGIIISRATVEHDRGTTTIVQTGPSGGLLSRSVTHLDASGGRMTVETNGHNQIVATATIDSHGMATVTRGFVSASEQILTLAPTKSAERPVLLPAVPASISLPQRDSAPHDIASSFVEPLVPPPLAMPASALPSPVAPPPGIPPSSPAEIKLRETKEVSPLKSDTKTSAAKPDAASAIQAKPAATPSSAALPAIAALPVIAPLPPRREAEASKSQRGPKAGIGPKKGVGQRRLTPVIQPKRSAVKRPRRRR